MASKKAVIGLVATQTQAENIIRTLQIGGFSTDDISVLFPDKKLTRDFAYEQSTKAPEGALAGASAGGALGGTLGVLLSVGALTIPGLGPVVAAGPILAALSGAAAGAAVGGLTGALIGMGIPEIEAKQYEGKIHGGSILMSVHAADAGKRTRAKYAMENGGATDVVTVGEQTVPTAAWGPAHPRT
jgi:hypothetical protein